MLRRKYLQVHKAAICSNFIHNTVTLLAMIAEYVTLLVVATVQKRLVEVVDLSARGHRYMTARSVVVPRAHSLTPDAADHSAVNITNKCKLALKLRPWQYRNVCITKTASFCQLSYRT